MISEQVYATNTYTHGVDGDQDSHWMTWDHQQYEERMSGNILSSN